MWMRAVRTILRRIWPFSMLYSHQEQILLVQAQMAALRTELDLLRHNLTITKPPKQYTAWRHPPKVERQIEERMAQPPWLRPTVTETGKGVAGDAGAVFVCSAA